MKENFSEIDLITQKLKQILLSDQAISEDVFFPLVGEFSKSLKQILIAYFTQNKDTRESWAPLINYYRQLQNYLVFILRFPTILLVPHHSEILQTLSFI